MIERQRPRYVSAALLAAAILLAPVSAARAAEPSAAEATYVSRPEVRAFIDEMVANYGFNRRSLRRLFADVRYQPQVIAAISRPVVSPPKWYEFAPRFLAPERVDAGVAFWREHEAALTRAEQDFGVAPEIIVAIIGVETYYGRYPGNYRVIDALTTLAFDYPRRAEFFRDQLKQFLLLMREQRISPLTPKGSYAGAMGLPQFMPGSVRAYALDYDSDGSIDLAANPDDAIGSVGNYLLRHGWQRGQPLMSPALIEEDAKEAAVATASEGVSERRALAAWESAGVSAFELPVDLAPDPVGLLMLEEDGGPSYWVVFNNWFVVTTYNRSRLYASAVAVLAQVLKDARPGQ
jgi:membrane-bound lytic murein transglycosylase B